LGKRPYSLVNLKENPLNEKSPSKVQNARLSPCNLGSSDRGFVFHPRILFQPGLTGVKADRGNGLIFTYYFSRRRIKVVHFYI
jgi:hypothetical protein